MIVVDILDRALVFKFNNKLAKLDRVAAAGGEPSRWLPEEGRVMVGGRWETQSCTNRETWGFESRLRVFNDWAFVVIMIVGCE